MAQLVSIIGITHNPFHHRLVSQPRSEWPEYTVRMVDRGEKMRDYLRRAEPESLIVVGNDHFHQFFMDNMPPFVLGKMELFDGIFYNEVREFDLPRCRIPGDVELAQQLLEGSLRKGVDFAFSNEMIVDHSVVVPLMLARPELDLPIVPIMTNCVAPPMPPAERFHRVGQVLREVIDEMPGNRRIGVVVSGHFALEVGGPLQFAPHSMDEEFDDQALDWIKRGDAKAAVRECTFQRLTDAGNVSYAFTNFILAMGIAGDLLPSYAEALKRPASTQAFFAWEPLAQKVG